jgi:hypothetical protein
LLAAVRDAGSRGCNSFGGGQEGREGTGKEKLMKNWVDWREFWQKFAEDPDDIAEIGGCIWRDLEGRWWAVFMQPNSQVGNALEIEYNPWTGEKL